MRKLLALAFLLFSAVCVACLLAVPEGLAQGRRQATLAQQKMCADQAKKFFADAFKVASFGATKKTVVMFPPSYVDHYDAKANVCYVAILREDSIDGGKTMTTSSAVYDAFEGTAYATYISISTSDKVMKLRELKPFCEVYPRGQAKVTCKSEGEFNELVKKYFGLVLR